jgi:hypothetical protein
MNAFTEARTTEEAIRDAIHRLDFESVRRTYDGQDQFVYLRDVFPPPLIEALRKEAIGLRSRIVRNRVPLVRKGGFVGYQTLRARAPEIISAYRSPSFIDFLSRLSGKQLFLKAESDPHACVLYYYTHPGDHLGYHYDTCGCEEGASYTALLGLVDESTQILHCQLFKKDTTREIKHVPVKTTPGSLVAFNGSTVWHRVTGLGRDEQRVVLSLSYRTECEMTPVRRMKETLKDRLLFIGLSDFLPWRRD